MIHPILRMGDERLLRIAKPVTEFDTPELHALVADMFETMHHAHGAGLAAPQIGVDLRLVIFGYEASGARADIEPVPATVLINPTIELLTSETERAWEGCLSVPGMRGVVARALAIRYRGFDPSGRIIDREAKGWHARVVQHECDHLDGILYPMRIEDLRSFGFTEALGFSQVDDD